MTTKPPPPEPQAPPVSLLKRFTFVASHALAGMQEGHACATVHAHNYTLELRLQPTGGLQNGLVIDSGRLKVDVRPVLNRLSNTVLNDLTDPAPWAKRMAAQPTIEHVALYFWEALGFLSLSNGAGFKLVSVRVYEDESLSAEVTE